jgi:hypothetical protein
MDYKLFLILTVGIALLYYGMFKLKAKENIYEKIFVLTIAIAGELIVVGKLLFENTIIFPIILTGGLISIFSMGMAIAWKERKNPEKRTYSYAYFLVMGFLVFYVITVVVLAKTGFFG